MGTRIIDGKTVAADLRGKVMDAVHRLRRDRGVVPGIAVVLVGSDPASEVYVRNKSKAVAESGMRSFDCEVRFAASIVIDVTTKIRIKSLIGREPMKRSMLTIAIAVLLAAPLARAAESIHLTVGYQPYDTISYSAVVIRGLELWKKHLPPGSTVDFESALQGAIIVNAMLADKQQIGYLGDMPAVVSTTKTKQAPIKLVASTGLSAGQRCNVIMVRADAPDFKTPEEAVKWLDGKTIATPRGSCADRFLRQVIEMAGIKPKEVLNQSIEVIATNFRAKRIDAATLWEPSVSRIGDFVGEGIAREVVTGHNFNMPDGGFIAMREDFMKANPEIAKAWLETELEAQLFLLDPKNWEKVSDLVRSQTEGITTKMAWFSLFGAVPPERGGSPLRDEKPFTFDTRVRQHLDTIYTFLHSAKVIDVDKAPEGAIDDSIAVSVAKNKNQAVPIGVIRPLAVSQAPK